MDPAWLASYAEAWCLHPAVGGEGGQEALAALLAFMGEHVRYEDVPSGAVFYGHDGIRQMGAAAAKMSSDLTFEIVGCVSGQGSYAFESICRGMNTGAVGPLPGNGAPFSFRGVSVGEVSEGGLVTSHRDYWDLAGLLGQLGVFG
ncbi:MAG: ester cyclase [Actinomycetota bacterium]|nr:ester cyclase [Actinomycetota bacterium]